MNKDTALLNAMTIISVIESKYNQDNEILTTFTNYKAHLEVSFSCKTRISNLIKSVANELMDEMATLDVHWNENTGRDYVEISWKI